jgi:hypothetical protein
MLVLLVNYKRKSCDQIYFRLEQTLQTDSMSVNKQELSLYCASGLHLKVKPENVTRNSSK